MYVWIWWVIWIWITVGLLLRFFSTIYIAMKNISVPEFLEFESKGIISVSLMFLSSRILCCERIWLFDSIQLSYCWQIFSIDSLTLADNMLTLKFSFNICNMFAMNLLTSHTLDFFKSTVHWRYIIQYDKIYRSIDFFLKYIY